MEHAATLDAAAEFRAQRDAIESGRLLLADPDQVAPLISKVSELLRGEVTRLAEELQSEHAKLTMELEQTEQWKALKKEDRTAILDRVGLVAPRRPRWRPMSSCSRFSTSSAPSWKEKRQALAPKFAEARELAAKQLEPKSVTVRPPSATLKTPDDVTTYVEALRSELMEHVDAGETVIV